MPEVRIRGPVQTQFDDIGRRTLAQHTVRRKELEPRDANENGESTGILPIAAISRTAN
jgi:hypothetical protein